MRRDQDATISAKARAALRARGNKVVLVKRLATTGQVMRRGRIDDVMRIVEAKGLLAGGRTKDMRGRMPPKLVEAAMARTGITSETKLMEVALAHLVTADDYADWLLAQRGTVGPDLDLEF